jgi:hypothetical protein
MKCTSDDTLQNRIIPKLGKYQSLSNESELRRVCYVHDLQLVELFRTFAHPAPCVSFKGCTSPVFCTLYRVLRSNVISSDRMTIHHRKTPEWMLPWSEWQSRQLSARQHRLVSCRKQAQKEQVMSKSGLLSSHEVNCTLDECTLYS